MRGYGVIQAAIVLLLEAARRAVARSVNAVMTATYWEIGRRIVEFEQGGADRATYGDALIERLAKDLTQRFGRGFSRQNLGQMRAFYRAWPAQKICQTLSGKSSTGSVLETLSRESLAGAAGPHRCTKPMACTAWPGHFRCRGQLTYDCYQLGVNWLVSSMRPNLSDAGGQYANSRDR
jgi:hypothetical protein